MSTAPSSLHRNDLWALLAVGMAALALRILYLTTFLHTMPTALFPLNDAKMYWEMGLRLYREGWTLPHEGPFYQAPLYPYLLAFLHHLGIHRVEPVLWLQAGLGTINTMITYLLARFDLERPGAAMAALLFSAGHLVLFFETKILAELAGLFFFLLFCLVFLHWIRTEKTGWLVGSALLFSLAVLIRPNLLFTCPFLLLFFLWKQGGPSLFAWDLSYQAIRNLLLFFGIFTLGILPAPLRNGLVAGDWVPLCANSGITLYMGTNPAAQGGLAPVARLSNDIEKQQIQNITLAEAETGEAMTASQASAYWIKKTLLWALTHPGDFLILEGKKLGWALYTTPPAVNDSSHFEGQFIPLIRWTGVFTWLALLGGLCGIPWLWRERQRRFVLMIGAGYLLLSLVYYASDRFLLTVLPFGAISAVALIQAVCRHGFPLAPRQRILAGLGLLLAFLLTLNPGFDQNRQKEIALGYYNLGVFYESQNQLPRAAACYQMTLERFPQHTSALLNLGVLLARQGNLVDSTRLFERVLQIEPENRTAQNNLRINRERMP